MSKADLTPAYRDAYEQTSETLVRIAGLATAVGQLAISHTGINSSSPDDNAIHSFIALLEEKAEAAGKQHQAEYSAVFAKAEPC